MHGEGLSYNFKQQKSLSYNSIHQIFRENACHTIFIHCRKIIEKDGRVSNPSQKVKFYMHFENL